MIFKNRLVPEQPFYDAHNANLLRNMKWVLAFAALPLVAALSTDKSISVIASVVLYVVSFGLLAVSVVLIIVAGQRTRAAVQKLVREELNVELSSNDAQNIIMIIAAYAPPPQEQPSFEIRGLPNKAVRFENSNGSTHAQLV